jgi:hypothetical protein
MEQLNRRETVEVLDISVVLRRNWTATLTRYREVWRSDRRKRL